MTTTREGSSTGAAQLLREAEVLLLDQGRTFMFDNDRFGPHVDYEQTYAQLGGARLIGQVRGFVERLFDALDAQYRDPSASASSSFPTVEQMAERLGLGFDAEEALRFARLIGVHELGVISDAHRAVLRSLVETHRLGVVSNFWGHESVAERNLQRSGVWSCFEHRLWSSQHGCIKPAPALFRLALERFGVSVERVVFIGDDPWRDVHPAKLLGLKAVWISRKPGECPPELLAPDLVIADLEELRLG